MLVLLVLYPVKIDNAVIVLTFGCQRDCHFSISSRKHKALCISSTISRLHWMFSRLLLFRWKETESWCQTRSTTMRHWRSSDDAILSSM